MLPAFVELSERLESPMPDLCPRIRLRVTDTPRPNDVRLAGEGSLDQIRSDLATFEELGCTWILLDTYHDYLVDELADPQRSWDMFEAVATEIFDLSTESLR